MDSIFELDDGGRATFLQQMLYSFGAAYVCLWSYVAQPISNYLISMDGLYVEENNQSTCSSESHARRLFDEYRQSVLFVRGIDGVPGLAFKNGVPYMELKLRDLRRLATLESQLQFYQEARIKTAIFMGCKTGEIELGISNDTQVNLEMEMRNWFPDNFARQIAPPIELPHPTDQPRPSSSSSSLTSLSRGSPEVSPFLFSIPNTSSLLEPPVEAPIEQALRPIPTSSLSPFTQFPTFQLPTLETRKATTTEAGTSQKPSAFMRFRSALRPSTTTVAAGVRKPNIQKRAIAFFRGLSLTRIQGQVQGTRPSSPQLHHMISERKRREQLNKTFQALRSLPPPGTKKDKASVLASTLDYIASLKAQVEELTKRSNVLEEKVQPLTTKKEANDQQEAVILSPNQRPDVRITHEAESSSSSLTSLSRGSPEVSPFLFSIPNTSSLLEPPVEAPIEQALRPISTSSLSPFTQIPTFLLPTLETRKVTTTEAGTSQKPSAFMRFRSALPPSTTTVAAGVRKPNIQKRAIAFFRGLSLTRIQGQVQGTRPSSPQLHHMISERKRREQLNKTFQALRSLLPSGTKKDKASVLASTLDYIASLKAQVEELTKGSKVLEEKVQPLTTKKEANDQQEAVSLSPNQRPDVRITHEAESPSQAQVIGLQVVLRGECNVMDLVTRILGDLRQVENASLMSVEADTQVVDSNPMNVVRLKLRIEDVNAEVGKPQKRQREQLLGASLGLKDDKQGLEQEVVALLRKHITEQIQGMTELQEKERVGISYCESTVGTSPEGGVLSMDEVVKLNEIGEAVKKRQKLFPEGKESLTRVSDEVSHSLEEELLEEISLKELEEAHSDPEELEELDCDPVEVPPTISHHFSILRMLDLSYTVIKCLPQSISRLVALQKLFLRNCELLMELPPEIGELTNLEVLDLEQTEIRFLPKEIAKLVNLTCLKVSFYGYANQTVIPRRVLPNLSRLNELIIDVTPYGEWWDVEVEAIIDDLCSLKKLRTLKLYLPAAELLEDLTLIFPGLANFRFTLGRHEEHFISCLPHALEEEFNNWEKLEKGLKYINGNCIPHEITKVFKNANAFFLQRHWTAESLSEFGHENMNAVKFCLVMECNEFRTIIDSKQFYQGKDGSSESGDFQDFENAIVLASLEKLVILYMKNLESIWKGPIGTGSLSNLKSLALHTCPCLTTLFTIDMLNNLRNLEELIVEDCPKIDSLVSLKSSGSNLGCFLPSLKKISLLELPELPASRVAYSLLRN